MPEEEGRNAEVVEPDEKKKARPMKRGASQSAEMLVAISFWDSNLCSRDM